jgi:hypothetical protein
MLRAVVQQIMSEFNGTVLEESKIVALKSHGAKCPLEFIGMNCCTEPGLTGACIYI